MSETGIESPEVTSTVFPCRGRYLRTAEVIENTPMFRGRLTPPSKVKMSPDSTSHSIFETTLLIEKRVFVKQFDKDRDGKAFENEAEVVRHLQRWPRSADYVPPCVLSQATEESVYLMYEYAFETPVNMEQWRKGVETAVASPGARCNVLRAYTWLHDQNVAHVDVKPANIVMDLRTPPNLKLVDFERSVLCLDAAVTLDERVLKVPSHYAHHERLLATVGTRTAFETVTRWDDYAVALLLLETAAMWSGRTEATALQTMGDTLDGLLEQTPRPDAAIKDLLDRRRRWIETETRRSGLPSEVCDTLLGMPSWGILHVCSFAIPSRKRQRWTGPPSLTVPY